MYYRSLCKLCTIVIKFVVCPCDLACLRQRPHHCLKNPGAKWGCLGDVTEVLTPFHQKVYNFLVEIGSRSCKICLPLEHGKSNIEYMQIYLSSNALYSHIIGLNDETQNLICFR